MRSLLYIATVILPFLLPSTVAVKTHDWKTCKDSAFCRRGRALGGRAREATNWQSPYSIDPTSVVIASNEGAASASVKNSLYPDIKFQLDLQVLRDGVVRVRMDEVGGLRKRYDEATSWALVTEPEVSTEVKWTVEKNTLRATYGEKSDITVSVAFQPLKISLIRSGKEEVVLNGEGLLHMEHFRTKAPELDATEENVPEEGSDDDEPVQKVMEINPRVWFEGEEDGWWEEKFGTWTDKKPKGPESLSVDINFPQHKHVYGIPQHATHLSLPTTIGENPTFTEPYRLYNADVFEYLASSPMSLYGSIPVMYAQNTKSTVGVFNVVASETWIDVAHPSAQSTHTHWISESGILDVFLLPGPTPADIFAQYTRLTGTPALPADWALGYHQCRWNYVSSDDVRSVQKRFDEADMPVDVFWLDIEYSEGHKYFMWDKKTFPDPVEMVKDVEAVGRKMVVIVDPHIKRADDYPVYKTASELQVFVKPSSGEGEYEGWCWPGSSSWIDFFNPMSWDMWKTFFKTTPQQDKWSWIDSTENVGIWNDMNEPSVFNGPEITMPKDNVHYGGWEHRDVHNINGMLFANMTWQALYARSNPPKRPFVLTRSFFAGSQRYGAMWTGDNMGTWEHMAVGVKMVLANGIAGMTFSGADVGGFFGNPEPEMLVRWYQVGAFAPFFRAHAHIDTKRREPYLLDQPYQGIIKNILRLRYALLPVWYTAFREASVTGMPVLRPQFVMFPKDEDGFAIDDQYYIAGGLLVKPITEKGVRETTVYLSDKQVYYDYFTHNIYRGGNKNITIKADLHEIPLLLRGGSIIPTRERPRRSSPLMKHDPFTLRIALDNKGTARGEVYLDAGDNFTHERGNFVWREFSAESSSKGKTIKLRSSDMAASHPSEAISGVALATYNDSNDFARSLKHVRIEKVIILGLSQKPKSVKLESGLELEWEYKPGTSSSGSKDGIASSLIIKDPAVSITSDWVIIVE